MRLPNLVYAGGVGRGGQAQFGGYNHNLGAGDGELWDMQNLTSDYFPLLASRAPRLRCHRLEQPGGLYCWEKLCWVDGTGFYFDGKLRGQVSQGEKSFTALGAYVVIMPDKAWYNVDTGEFGSMESVWSGDRLTFSNGLLFEEEAECNTIQCPGINWSDFFRAGDAVTIEGCNIHPENNKTSIIREINGDKLSFYEYVFVLDGEEGTTPYTETGNLSVKRTVPDMRYICENENRLWGCDERTIYACKPGDIFNWNVYDGLDTDSFYVDTGSAGVFTGCCAYLGYPIFFKEEHIYKVYGSLPSNFEVMGSATLGVMAGSHKSLAIAGEALFYLSRAGIIAYQGGVPQPIGAAFGKSRFRAGVAGSDGLKYYVSMEDELGDRRLYVYDTQRGLWHVEDHTEAKSFAFYDGALYWLDAAGDIWAADQTAVGHWPEGAQSEGPVTWWAEFSDFTDNDPNKKGLGKLQLRLELEAGASVSVYLKMDSEHEWRLVDQPIDQQAKRSYILPIVPERADHYRLKLEGVGECRVYSITRGQYSGSDLRSRPGRN